MNFLRHILCGALVLIFVVAFEAPLHAADLRISVAASMTDVFKDIIKEFSKEQPNIRVLPNFGASGGLAKQIYQGAPADLYVSANTTWMQYLSDNKKIENDSLYTLAHNSLVLVGVSANSIKSLSELTEMKRIGIGSPGSVPAGQYARQALEELGLYDMLLQAGKLVMAKDVRQALIYADRGETAASFVYKTDALLAKNAVILFEIPQELYPSISYRMALTTTGSAKKEARMFYDFVTQFAAQTVVKYGFRPPQ
jgi:molybdate transport system substrate-binding protein